MMDALIEDPYHSLSSNQERAFTLLFDRMFHQDTSDSLSTWREASPNLIWAPRESCWRSKQARTNPRAPRPRRRPCVFLSYMSKHWATRPRVAFAFSNLQ